MEPVRLTREIDGFIANRLQAALLWEGLPPSGGRLRHGEGHRYDDLGRPRARRWSFIGPFETIDLNAPGGLADFCARLGDGFYEFIKQSEPRPALVGRSRRQGARGAPRALTDVRAPATARRGGTGASWASQHTLRDAKRDVGGLARQLVVDHPVDTEAVLPSCRSRRPRTSLSGDTITVPPSESLANRSSHCSLLSASTEMAKLPPATGGGPRTPEGVVIAHQHG